MHLSDASCCFFYNFKDYGEVVIFLITSRTTARLLFFLITSRTTARLLFFLITALYAVINMYVTSHIPMAFLKK